MKTLSREDIQRMTNSTGIGGIGRNGGGTGGSGSGGNADYAAEAGHALEADHATSADSATEATHATSADSATTATTAQNLASDSTDWQKIARKDIAQTIAEVWTFAKGIVSTLRSYFNGGATISKASSDTGKALQVTGGTQTDTLDASGNATVGGTLDVTSGVLTVDRANIASYNGETLPSTWISDRDVYSSGTTPTTGAQVVYALATSQTYQLTPEEVKTVLGQNNIFADVGSINTITFRTN